MDWSDGIFHEDETQVSLEELLLLRSPEDL